MSTPTPSRGRPGPLRRTLLRPRAALLCIGLVGLTACQSDCSCAGFEARPFPAQHYDKTLVQGAQVRVSPAGLDFVEQNIEQIVDGAVPGGLSFCLAKSDSLCFAYRADHPAQGIKDGDQPMCDDGSQGCQLNLAIDGASIDPQPSKRLNVNVTIGDLNPIIPFKADGPLGITARCDVTVYKRGSSRSTPASIQATLPIDLEVDANSPTRDLSINVGEIDLDMDDLDFDIKGGFTCGAADFLRGLLRGTIEGQLRDQLSSTVSDLTRQNLCRSCADDATVCGQSATCASDGICEYGGGECVPATLGTEGRMALGTLLDGYTETPEAGMDMMLKAADYAEVDTGVTLGMRSGFVPDGYSRCVPVDPQGRPDTTPVPISPTLRSDTRPGSGEPFMLGVGVHRNTIEHALWSAWASGATCLGVDSSVSEQLSTGALGILLRSIRRLSDDQSNGVEIKIVPQKAPQVILGANTVTPSGDTYTVQEGLMTIDWRDLDLHMYGWVQDRWTRMFSVRIDLLLPVAVVPDGAGQVGVVLGDFEEAITNVRTRNSQLLTDSPEKIAGLIPTLVGLALPSLASALDLSFELPEFVGLRVALEQGDITSIDNGEAIGLFANLEVAPMMQMAQHDRPRPAIGEASIHYPEPILGDLVRPQITIDVSARAGVEGLMARDLVAGEVEFAWRVDGGIWSHYHRADALTIDDPRLALPGDHVIEVRSRLFNNYRSTNRKEIARRVISIDYQPPTLELIERGDRIVFDGRDLTDAPHQLTYRWRLHDGARAHSWSDWSEQDSIETAFFEAIPRPWRVEVEVRDRSGKLASDDLTMHAKRVQAVTTASAEPAIDSTTHSEPQAGCGVAPGQGSAPPWALLGVIGMMGLLTRRRRLTALAGILGALALGSSACSDDDAGTSSLIDCTPSCTDGQRCQAGKCVSNDCVGDDCEAACTSDAQCASACDGQGGTCAAGACQCGPVCEGGCGDGQYCCNTSASCQPIPGPCDGKVCPEGATAVPGNAGTPNSQTCGLDDATCDCIELDPLPLGYHGRYPSLARSGDQIVVAGYNLSYGDLMVGVVTDAAANEVRWHFVDGVPAEGEIKGNPNSYRGGIAVPGDDVGSHTATVFSEDGTLFVFYRDEKNRAIKVARGVAEGEGFSFEMTTLDDQGDAGRWSRAVVRDGAIHLVYQRAKLGEEDAAVSQLRHVALDPSAPIANWARVAQEKGVTIVEGPGDPGCTAACDEMAVVGNFTDLVETPEGLAVFYHDGARDQVAWNVYSMAEESWSMTRYGASPSGPYVTGAVDAEGTLHMAYMDEAERALIYEQSGSLNREVIHDGLRDTGEEWLVARIGESVTMRLDASGQPQVVFQDATMHRLMVGQRLDGDWSTEVLGGGEDTYDGARGFYTHIIRAEDEALAVDYVIHNQQEVPSAYPVFTTLP